MLLIHFDYWTWQESNHVMKLTPQQKSIMLTKTSKNKPTTELQKEKNYARKCFCPEMRLLGSAIGCSKKRSNSLLQIALIAAE